MMDIGLSESEVHIIFVFLLFLILGIGLSAAVFRFKNFAIVWTSLMLNILFLLYLSDPFARFYSKALGMIAIFVWPVANLTLIFNTISKKIK